MFDLLLVLDTRFREAPFLKELRLLDLFPRDDLRLFGLALAFGAVLGEFDALGGAADLDVVLLGDARVFAVALDVERRGAGLRDSASGSRFACAARSRCACAGALRWFR